MPASPLPSERDARQDRSLRLWGGDGQSLLEAGHVCLLGGTSTGAEVLKNTILPGLGRFTVVDDAKVTQEDLGNNFFLAPKDDLGANIAERLTAVLGELNPAAAGTSVVQSPSKIIREDSSFFERNGVKIILVTSRVNETDLITLSKLVTGKDIHVLHVEANGLLGLIRTQADPRYIIDSVPDPDLRVIDLRVFNPFPELKDYFERLTPDDENMEIDMHSHLPWPLLLFHANKKLGAEKGDANFKPANFAEWRELKKTLDTMVRRKEPVQDNFIEAKENATAAKVYVEKRNVPELQQVLADPRAEKPSSADAQFWFLAHGIKKFREISGTMPVTADIPDFTCTTEWYLQIKAIFRDKAEADVQTVLGYVREALDAAGRTNRNEGDEKELERQTKEVCKHCWELAALKFTSFADELTGTFKPAEVKSSTDEGLRWYVAQRAARRFQNKVGRAAGATKETIEADTAAIREEAAALLGGDASAYDVELKEMVRYGGGEPVTVSAIIGAVGGQEVIKLLQNKRHPVCDALIYDGVTGQFTTVKNA